MGENSEGRIAVIGLGTMGRSIARLLVNAGYEVRACDPMLGDLAQHGVQIAGSIEECVSGSAVVFEATSEDLDVKAKVLRSISGATDGIIASNTSTFMPSVLAQYVVQPSRFLIGHFFNPADLIPLVEVVPHAETRPETISLFTDMLMRLGKRPVLLKAERPGFVANRLQAALLREALSLIEGGVASAADVDAIVTDGLAARWAVAGPIGVADLGGLDVFRAVCEQIFPSLDNSTAPNALLIEKVSHGDLGAKSGRGFYQHSERSIRETQEAVSQILQAQKSNRRLNHENSIESSNAEY